MSAVEIMERSGKRELLDFLSFMHGRNMYSKMQHATTSSSPITAGTPAYIYIGTGVVLGASRAGIEINEGRAVGDVSVAVMLSTRKFLNKDSFTPSLIA